MIHRQDPIFIVGFPRSGTTLLAAMLAANSHLSCGPETRVFRFLEKVDIRELLSGWPDRALDFLFAVPLMDIPIPCHYNLSRDQIRAYLSNRMPSIRVLLSSLTEQLMIREGKQRWIEKSPEHLMYVHEVRRDFPDAKIIRIVRDPRDAALSMSKMPWYSHDFLEALLLWRKYDERSAGFFCNDQNCYTLRYENLVQSSEAELKQVCAFIGEEYESQMLDTSRSAGNLITEQETWKALARQPVDETRLWVWKRELSKAQNRIAEALIGDRLLGYGYACTESFDRAARVYPSMDSLLRHRDFLGSLVSDDVRFWQVDRNDKNQRLIYVGEPDGDHWLSHTKPERWRDVVRIITTIMKGRLGHQRIHWIRDQAIAVKPGYMSRLLTLVFQLAGERHGL